ncbi:AAA family ATPase [Legionella sp. PATHC032]|uniref:AAA family ATPase n=1 Tax=Legionella sp. PATHC032 TaxID=2992039 RepID=UPI001B22B772|nr:AAA family ATPase [Legionella sp. PATHC032]MCW8421834.1 AAA family ATPase [Legionella sp. PATHC032]HAZ7574254.1 AAA family ATPase [Legionella pneumophila]HBA1636412.1 AAA family ATPase [Legionella pneumophila]
MKTGLVLGKFMPPHKGHEMLISFAYQFVDKLHIIVDNVNDGAFGDNYIPGEQRVAWLQKKYPYAEVVCLFSPMPQDPNLPGFWQTWKDVIYQTISYRTDYVFAGELYGFQLAKNLGSTYIPIGILREIHPISATEIRNSLKENWDSLASFVKPDFLLKVAIIGPESSGKTTLTKILSSHYETTFVPEYARLYLEPILYERGINVSKMNFTNNDFLHIIHGQQIFETIQGKNAVRILFSDTDPLLTTLWYRWIMKTPAPLEIVNLALTSSYDLYLVTKPDITWTEDCVRYEEMQSERQEFFNQTINLLEANNRPYHIISGSYENRVQQAQDIIDQLIQNKFHHSYFSSKWQKKYND